MISLRSTFLFQAGIGISANTFLLFFCIFTVLLDNRPKHTDMTTSHLAVVHIMLLLSVVFLVSPNLFESLNFQDGLKCKVLFYMNRVMRGLSICTTCLLSVLQAITISPSTSWLARFKHTFTNYTFHIVALFWSLSLSCNSYIIFHTTASSNVTQTDMLLFNKYCLISPMNSIIRSLIFTLMLSRHVFFVGIMLLSSAYMVVLLFRHKRRSQHLHSTNLSSRASPEKRATRTILLLVSCFVVMYWVDFSISSSLVLSWVHDSVIRGVQGLLSNVYAIVSPLVLVSSDKRIINILRHMRQKCHRFLTSEP
uniref:Vomeronasal type-1 receptor n=1 Tax=Microcebus murinus TaxID=30608 RepID=A0A8C5XRE7_MICMU